MTILLDSHAFIWFNMGDPRLSDAARNVIEDEGNRIWISPASYWEIAIKISRGKYKVVAPYLLFWQKGINDNGFEILPIELRHTTQLLSLPFHHGDPFDRLLIAQALAEQVPLVSNDKTIDAYGVTRIW